MCLGQDCAVMRSWLGAQPFFLHLAPAAPLTTEGMSPNQLLSGHEDLPHYQMGYSLSLSIKLDRNRAKNYSLPSSTLNSNSYKRPNAIHEWVGHLKSNEPSSEVTRWAGVVARTCNASTGEAEGSRPSGVQGQTKLQSDFKIPWAIR